jgi:Rha family phage regulatory protein
MENIDVFKRLVLCADGQPITTSRKVADAFGKRHSDVLRAIRNLDCDDEFNERNFALVDFIDVKGEVRQEYTMTKDGMAFLVMGFTGKESAKWKVAYIRAFNWMASKLQERHEIDMLMHDFTRRELASVSDGSFHGRGLAKRKVDKSNLADELASINSRLQFALELIEK